MAFNGWLSNKIAYIHLIEIKFFPRMPAYFMRFLKIICEMSVKTFSTNQSRIHIKA